MDPVRFDTLSRSLRRTPSRRTALRTSLGGIALAALGWASAAPASRAKKKRKKKGPACPACPAPPAGVCCAEGQAVCGGACVELNTNSRHCGTCGKRCQLNAICVGGTCTCVNGTCGSPNQSCCPPGSGTCSCTLPGNGFTRADTCDPVASCPADMTPCVGPECAACCPAGTTCDTATGTCLP